MTSPVRIGDATLYLGDCREILPSLGQVDAVVSDPPYGIAYARGAGGAGVPHGSETRRNLRPLAGDREPFDPAPLLDLAPDVILWGADHYAQRLPHGRWLAWDKLDGREPWDSFSDVEFAWHNRRGAARIFRHLWKGIIRGSENNGERRVHPTQKPIALMDWCLSHLPATVRVICDPYMGSGTTGVACVRRGLRFIGVEIDPTYFEAACRRIEEAYRQAELFQGAAE